MIATTIIINILIEIDAISSHLINRDFSVVMFLSDLAVMGKEYKIANVKAPRVVIIISEEI